MFRTTALPAAGLLAAGLLIAAPTAAAGETCQGRAATIVGADRRTPIVGTDGPDVIVSTGARTIDARGGDDLICVVDASVRRLDAGPGDDVVDVSAGYGSSTVLGAGADTFIGSPGSDRVWAGTSERDGSVVADRETDVIDTGDGQQADEVLSGERGSPNGDQVRVGVLAEVSWAGTPTASSVLSSGRFGMLTVDVRTRDRVRIDNVSGMMTFVGAPPLAIPGFTDFTVRSASGPRDFEFLGNDSGERLHLSFGRTKAHRVDLGGGRNSLSVTTGRALAPGTHYRAGSGRDSLSVTLPTGRVDVHLGRNRLTTRSGRLATRLRIPGFEEAAATARVARLVGTPGRDSLYVAACDGRVEGLAGADQLDTMQVNRDLRCASYSVTILGGPGKDYLTGSPGPDLLLGGAGEDSASGRGGRDTCEAENRSSCERRS